MHTPSGGPPEGRRTHKQKHTAHTLPLAGPEPNPPSPAPTSHRKTPLSKPLPLQLQPMAVRVVHKPQHHPLGVARRAAPKPHTRGAVRRARAHPPPSASRGRAPARARPHHAPGPHATPPLIFGVLKSPDTELLTLYRRSTVAFCHPKITSFLPPTRLPTSAQASPGPTDVYIRTISFRGICPDLEK